ncbi:MAG: DUF975 family protein [Clostridia bacterium]|nr:DUF975 family protein [Clostridia bacterium]
MTISEIKAKARQQLGGKIFGETWLYALVVCLLVSLVLGVSSMILIGEIIVFGPLYVAESKLFLKQARTGEKMNIIDVFSGFSDDFGGNCILGLMQTLFIFLWSLLFIVPGIIKAYAYSMAYFIKVDHPEYDWKECLDRSQEMMLGRKWKLFVQDLSFIGWIIVGILCFGIGLLWVDPYIFAARTQFYKAIVDEEKEELLQIAEAPAENS